jgi:PAS domain S-box-containing protein
MRETWQQLSLIDRIRWLRYGLPPLLILVVIIYQLGVAQALERNYGHVVHYSVEISFYSLTGPLVTWLMLIWVERRLLEKEALERQVQARTEQLASLTAVSADAILSLDAQNHILSWNRGAVHLLGYQAEHITGRPLSLLLPDTAVLQKRLAKTGIVQNFETTAQQKNGRLLTVNLSQTSLPAVDHTTPASLIIMRDITARKEREAILSEERGRIARDLHDGVAQTLYFLALKGDMAQQQIAPHSEAVASEIKEMSRTARQVIRDVRRTIYALRPLDWVEGQFVPELQRFISGYAEQMGWKLNINLDSSITLPTRLEPTIYRLTQESLNNIAKHADANLVWITLSTNTTNSQIELIIRDDGAGFNAEAASQPGLGLTQMHARAKASGGMLIITSDASNGTIIKAYFPVDEGRTE